MCHPVHFGSVTEAKSSTRESTAPSISGTRPAIGSIISHLYRLGANCSFASATLPARTASVNFFASVRRPATCDCTQVL